MFVAKFFPKVQNLELNISIVVEINGKIELFKTRHLLRRKCAAVSPKITTLCFPNSQLDAVG